MQLVSDMVVISNLATVVLSASLGFYLFHHWYRQENRLTSDLPLVFAISFVTQALNTLILLITNMDIIPMTMNLFRVRATLIAGSVVPVIGALLEIWLPKIRKYHNWIIIAFITYWIGIILLGTTQEFIMTFLIPMIMIGGVGMMLTFIVTWKTGRLKEIRSDFIVLGSVLGMLSQAIRVPLLATRLFFLSDIILTASIIVVFLGLTNPWYRRKNVYDSDRSGQIIPVPAGQ